MRMMMVVVGLSALMGWQGIPLRLASLAACPLRFAKGGGQPRGLPLQGFAPPLSLRDISPASGGKRNPPHQRRNTKQPQPIIRIIQKSFPSWFKIPPSLSARGRERSERGMPCHTISEETSADYTQSFSSFPNPSNPSSHPSGWAFRPLDSGFRRNDVGCAPKPPCVPP